VVDAVDLDHHAPPLPDHVEVVAAVPATAQHLTARLGDAPAAALPSEVEIPQSPNPAQQVAEHLVQQGTTPIAPDPEQLATDLLCRDDPLLSRHGHQQTSLSVGHSPQGAAHDGDLRAGARESPARQVVGMPPTRLPDVVPGRTTHPRPSRHGDPDPGAGETLQTRCLQGGRTIEAGARTALEDGGVQVTGPLDRSVVQAHRLVTDKPPPPAPHLSTAPSG